MEPGAGPSIWEQAAFHRPAGLAVVGGGLVGLFAALFHQRRFPAHRVVVLERGAFPSGASARNAGFACFGSPSELLADMDREGADAALARVEERWRGLRELRAELGDGAIGYEPCGGYELYRADDELYARVAGRFNALNDALRPILGPDAFRWDAGAPGRFGLSGVAHAAFTPLEGALDSGLLLRALLRKAAEAGVELRFGAGVTGLDERPDGVTLRLADGGALRAERLLVATNGFTPALLPQLDVQPARGQVLLTAPVPGLRLHGTFHLEEGFYYFRHCRGGVLLGGGRHLDLAGERTMDEGLTPVIQEALERLLRETILPGQPFAITHRWSGTMAFGSAGKQPLVQRLSDRVGVAVRLGGMGVAIGIRVARRAVELMAA